MKKCPVFTRHFHLAPTGFESENDDGFEKTRNLLPHLVASGPKPVDHSEPPGSINQQKIGMVVPECRLLLAGDPSPVVFCALTGSTKSTAIAGVIVLA